MAEKIVNSGIEFVYASDDSIVELKRELEKYFLYQKILIVDSFYEYSDVIEKMREQIHCDFVVERAIQNLTDDIDCVILVNDCNVDKIKKECYEKKIPYMFVLTKVVSSGCFSNQCFDNFNVLNCNFPFGIILDKTIIYDKKEFICSSAIEIANMKFDILQKKLCNLFFNIQIDYDKLDDQQKTFNQFEQFFCSEEKNQKILFNNSAEIYLQLCLKTSQNGLDLLDKLEYLFSYQNFSKNSKSIEQKYIFKQIVSSFQKNYFKYFVSTFSSNVNYEKHSQYLQSFGLSYSVHKVELTDSKTNFLLNEFRQKMLDFVTSEIEFDKRVKNFLADISIDFVYKMFNFDEKTNFTNYICLEPDIFKENSFLTVMLSQGLLNFEI